MKKRAAVVLTYEACAGVLHLRAGISVIGAKVNPEDETVEFFLDGEGLPPVARRERILRYALTELADFDL